MIEIMYDISSGSNYKFNTAFIGEQVQHEHTIRRLIVYPHCPCINRRNPEYGCVQTYIMDHDDICRLARFLLRVRSVVVHPESSP